MAIRKVARMGHPVLRKIGKTLTEKEIKSEEIQRLIVDMHETMIEYEGIGLAAPQIHESLQLAIIEFGEDSDRYPGMGAQGLTVFINPKITILDTQEQGFWEGCLSVPELRGLVYRPRKVQVEFLDEKAKPQKIVAEGFLATVIQHELDHLQGTLFIDRLKNEPGKTPLAFTEEYARYWAPEEGDDVGELDD
ncbi:MAG: peptide deformylase [Bdellovibrionales bacterium]|nr:peptide deformylase [Bdellovibrionales bacterium]